MPASGGEVDTVVLVIAATLRMEMRNFENCPLEETKKRVAEETTLPQEGVMGKAMARQLVEEL